MGPVQLQAAAMCNEHRHPGAISAGVAHLLDLERRGVERDLRRVQRLERIARREVAVHRGRRRETREAQEGLFVLGLAVDAGHRAQAGQRCVVEVLASQVEHADLRASLREVGRHEVAIDELDGANRVVALRDQLGPVLRSRLAQIDGDHAAARSCSVGEEVELHPGVAQKLVARGETGQQLGGFARLDAAAQIGDDDARLGIGADFDGDDQIPAIVGDVGRKAPVLVVWPRVDQRIIGLGVPETMVVELLLEVQRFEFIARLGLGVAGVEEALGIGGPGWIGELDPAQLVALVFPGGDVSHPPALPIRAGFGHAPHDLRAVGRAPRPRQRDRAVFGERVGIEQHPALALERVHHVGDRLVLQAVVLRHDVHAAVLVGHAVAFVVPQCREPFCDRVAGLDLLEHRLGQRSLGIHPLPSRRAVDVLEPPIRIGDVHSVVAIDGLAALCGRVHQRDRRRVRCRGRPVRRLGAAWRGALGTQRCRLRLRSARDDARDQPTTAHEPTRLHRNVLHSAERCPQAPRQRTASRGSVSATGRCATVQSGSSCPASVRAPTAVVPGGTSPTESANHATTAAGSTPASRSACRSGAPSRLESLAPPGPHSKGA